MEPIKQVEARFQLGLIDLETVERCKTNYSGPISLSSIWNRFCNAILHIFGQSDWQNAEKVLQEKAIRVLTDNFPEQYVQENLPQKAHALSEYILRYLTQPSSESLSIDEVIDRAPFGDGTTLPPLTRSTLIDQIQHTRDQYTKVVDAFKTYFGSPQVLLAESFAKLIERPNNQTASLLGMPKQDTQQDSTVTVIGSARKAVAAAGTVLHQINQIQFSALKGNVKNEDLYLTLSGLRNNQNELVELYKKFKHRV